MKTFLTILHITGYLTTIWCIYLAYTTWDYTIDRIREEWMNFRRSIYIRPIVRDVIKIMIIVVIVFIIGVFYFYYDYVDLSFIR